MHAQQPSSQRTELAGFSEPTFRVRLTSGERSGDYTLSMAGEICTHNVARSTQRLLRWLRQLDREDVTHVCVDLSGVNFIDSRGVLLLAKMIQQGNIGTRTLRFGEVSPEVQRLLQICGLAWLLNGGSDPPEQTAVVAADSDTNEFTHHAPSDVYELVANGA